MWDCTIRGDATATDYGGYASIFDNIVSFLLYHHRSARNYIELIKENRDMFIGSPKAYFRGDLVEPRELISLIKQIEFSHRLHWAPRPLKGFGSVMKDYLFLIDNILFCIFCGSRSHLVRKETPASPVSQEEGTLGHVSEYFYERLDPFINPSSTTAKSEQQTSRITEPKYFHFHNCPLIWLQKNCRLTLDLTTLPSTVPSKFYFAMQMTQYTSARCINTEIEWSEWVFGVQHLTVMGACELTLVRLFRKVIEMKLASVDVRQLDLFQQHIYAFHYEESNSCGAIKTAKDAGHFLDSVLCSPDRIILLRNESKLIYTLDTDCAWKTFVMHGFCVQMKTDSKVRSYEIDGDFSHTTANAYTVNTTLDLPMIEMMCIYCGVVFDGKLCKPDVIEHLYTKRERRLISEYLLNSVSLPSQKMRVSYKWDFWERSPSAENKAFQVEDVLTSMELHETIEQRNQNEPLSNREKIALWFSTSLNLAHSPTCIFRYKKRVFGSRKCPVCMDVLETTRSPFNCGHSMCMKCVNDIRITVCPVCKSGTRKFRLKVFNGNEFYV